MQQMLKQAQKMQAQVMAAQQQLVEDRVEGSAAGGLVSAVVTGTGELVGITLQPEAIDPDDAETLADLVVAAVRDAQRAAHTHAEATMGPLTGGMPGLGL